MKQTLATFASLVLLSALAVPTAATAKSGTTDSVDASGSTSVSNPGQTLTAANLTLGNLRFVQSAELISVPPPGPGAPPSPEEVAVQVALQWLAEHAYLNDPTALGSAAVDVSVGQSGITIVVSGPGLHIVIVLSNGPFFPVPEEPNLRLITGTIFERIFNGI